MKTYEPKDDDAPKLFIERMGFSGKCEELRCTSVQEPSAPQTNPTYTEQARRYVEPKA